MKQELGKQATGFTQIKNDVLNDENLSLKAKGLFAYIYSKPNGWDFSAERIALQSNDGRKSVNNGLQELESSGYLTRIKKKDGRTTYFIAFNPLNKPKSPKGKVPKRQSAKREHISNKEFYSNKEETSNKEDTSKFKNFSDSIYEEVNNTYKTKKQIADKKGIKLKRLPRSNKQEKAAIALSAITYLKQKTAEIHGYYYLRQDDSRNKTVIKLAVKTLERVPDLKPLIDWYLNEDFEWCKYAPENCFAIKTIEEFENKDNKKTKTHFNC